MRFFLFLIIMDEIPTVAVSLVTIFAIGPAIGDSCVEGGRVSIGRAFLSSILRTMTTTVVDLAESATLTLISAFVTMGVGRGSGFPAAVLEFDDAAFDVASTNVPMETVAVPFLPLRGGMQRPAHPPVLKRQHQDVPVRYGNEEG